MPKLITKTKWLAFLPLWLLAVGGFIFLNFLGACFLAIKKSAIFQRFAYFGAVQACKEKITGRPRIIKNSR